MISYLHYQKYNVNVNVKFIVFILIYKKQIPDLGLYQNGRPVYGCKRMPMPPHRSHGSGKNRLS
jgi:hypothetical protein